MYANPMASTTNPTAPIETPMAWELERPCDPDGLLEDVLSVAAEGEVEVGCSEKDPEFDAPFGVEVVVVGGRRVEVAAGKLNGVVAGGLSIV